MPRRAPATKAQAKGIEEIAVGEQTGITLPTRFSLKKAGYPDVMKRHGVKVHYFDEVKQVPVDLKKEGSLRDHVFVPKPIKDCDFLINLPKFKAHPWTRLTLSLKNFIGLQEDRHKMVDHNSLLEHKIADLQEVIQPSFIAMDAIVAGQKSMVAPAPFPMGAIVMGVNSCAVDTVCCHMVHVDPKDLVHLRYAAERGFGPMTLDGIQVSGDFPLEEIQGKTKDFEFCLERIDNYFGEESNLSCTVGNFPEQHSPDYCWGGCPGALQEAMEIFRSFNPNVEREMKKVRYVVGQVEDSLELAEDERVIFAGDCTSWQGSIDGERVNIESNYKKSEEIADPQKACAHDMLSKIFCATWRCLTNRSSRYIHAKGCPVTVAENVNYLSSLGKIANPNFDRRIAIPATIGYGQMHFNRISNRFLG